MVRNLGLATAGVVGFGAVTALLTQPAAAAKNLDVQILQTAVSLELLAVATYGAALTLPFIASGNQVIIKFAQTTMSQHDQHRDAFSAQTKALGGVDQTATNPKYTPIVGGCQADVGDTGRRRQARDDTRTGRDRNLPG